MSGIVNSSASRVESLSAGNSDANALESCLSFLVEAVALLNAFVQSAPDLRHQVVIQWEVEEAGLNIDALSQVKHHPFVVFVLRFSREFLKVAETTRSPLAVQLKQEIALWNENQINVALLLDRLTNVTSTNEALRKDLLNLRSRLLVGSLSTLVKNEGPIHATDAYAKLGLPLCREIDREKVSSRFRITPLIFVSRRR